MSGIKRFQRIDWKGKNLKKIKNDTYPGLANILSTNSNVKKNNAMHDIVKKISSSGFSLADKRISSPNKA